MPLYDNALRDLLATYKYVIARQSKFTSETVDTYVLNVGTGNLLGVGSDNGKSIFYFDPAKYAVPGRTTYARLAAAASSNATDPGGTFTFKLFPVTTAGADGSVTVTLGAQAGTSAVVANPGASATAAANSADFAVPAAGLYVMTVTNSANIAVNSDVGVSAVLEVRQV